MGGKCGTTCSNQANGFYLVDRLLHFRIHLLALLHVVLTIFNVHQNLSGTVYG